MINKTISLAHDFLTLHKLLLVNLFLKISHLTFNNFFIYFSTKKSNGILKIYQAPTPSKIIFKEGQKCYSP